MSDIIIQKQKTETMLQVLRGQKGWTEMAKGKGRGHWGHKGRKGKRGGSLPGKGEAVSPFSRSTMKPEEALDWLKGWGKDKEGKQVGSGIQFTSEDRVAQATFKVVGRRAIYEIDKSTKTGAMWTSVGKVNIGTASTGGYIDVKKTEESVKKSLDSLLKKALK